MMGSPSKNRTNPVWLRQQIDELRVELAMALGGKLPETRRAIDLARQRCSLILAGTTREKP